MPKLVRQPSLAPMRKIAMTTGWGSVASAIFAAAPAIGAVFPPALPIIAAAQVAAPIVLGKMAYDTKEWGGVDQVEIGGSPAPLRKVTVMNVVAYLGAVIFAAEPQIVAAFPELGPIIEVAKVMLPALLGPLGYSVKEWAPTPISEPLADPGVASKLPRFQ